MDSENLSVLDGIKIVETDRDFNLVEFDQP